MDINSRNERIESNPVLFRVQPSNKESFSPKKIYIVGSGVIENSYRPIVKTINENPLVQTPRDGIFNLDNNQVIHWLANYLFAFKAARDQFLRETYSGNHKSITFYSGLINGFYEIRESLGGNYINTQKNSEIKLRSEFKKLFDGIDWTNSALVTTNWDEVIWSDFSYKNVIQLHGRSSFPESMIFPTEFSLDESIIGLTRDSFSPTQIQKSLEYFLQNGKSKKDFLDVFQRTIRSTSTELAVRNSHGLFLEWLGNAEEIVFCGIALNIYDSEVNSFITARQNAVPFKTVKNYNTDPKTRQIIASMTYKKAEEIEQCPDSILAKILVKLKQMFLN